MTAMLRRPTLLAAFGPSAPRQPGARLAEQTGDDGGALARSVRRTSSRARCDTRFRGARPAAGGGKRRRRRRRDGRAEDAHGADGHTMLLGSPLELIIRRPSPASSTNRPTRMVAQLVKRRWCWWRKDLPANNVDEADRAGRAAERTEKPLTMANTGPRQHDSHLVAGSRRPPAPEFVHVLAQPRPWATSWAARST